MRGVKRRSNLQREVYLSELIYKRFKSTSMQSNATENLINTKPDKAKVLALTTSYPSHEEDPSGVFIAKLLTAIRRRGYSVKVVAPSDGTFYGRRNVGGIETVRFCYFWPRSLERLTRCGGGIPENMAHSLLARASIISHDDRFFLLFRCSIARGLTSCTPTGWAQAL